MAINTQLAKVRGISLEDQRLINGIYDYLELIIAQEIAHGFNQEIFDEIETLEFELQRLWGFPQDGSFHKWKNEYGFKCEWVGRTFRCKVTGETFTIPSSVREGIMYKVGNADLDVGRGFGGKGYWRMNGFIEEVF